MTTPVGVSCTEDFIDCVETLLQQDLSKEDEKQLKKCLAAKLASATDLRLVSKLLQKYKETLKYSEAERGLATLLKGSTGVKFPREAVPMPSEELVERRKYLKARQDQREYARMCKDVSPICDTLIRDTSIAPEGDNSTFRQVGVGFNMLIAALAIFFVVNHICLNMQVSDAVRLTCGISAFIVVLIIEMVLFIIRATRIEKMDRTSKRKAADLVFPGHRQGGPRDRLSVKERLRKVK